MTKLQSLTKIKAPSKKRLGRGIGSGVGGHTVGRGTKGQLSRNSVPLWFEGGQLPLVKRLPMLRGKGRLKSQAFVEIVTLSQLEKVTQSPVTVDVLKQAGFVDRTAKQVKVLNKGEITKKIVLEGIAVSASAKAAIEKAGGTVS